MKLKIQTGHVLCSVLIALGALAYGAQCAIDVATALRHAVDDTGRTLQTTLLVLMAGGTFGLSAFAGWRIRAGSWLMGLVCFALSFYFLIYSFSNSVGFSFEQTVGKQKLVEWQNKQARDITALQAQSIAEERKAQREWAQRTYEQQAKSRLRSDRADAREFLKEQQQELSTSFKPLVMPRIEEVMPDGKAQAIGGFLGLEPEAFRFLDSAYLALGIVMIKWLFPALGFGYWPRGSRDDAAAPAPVPVPVEKPLDLPQPMRTVDRAVMSEERQHEEMTLVREWLATQMMHVPQDKSRTMLATEAYRAFTDWAQQAKRQGHVLTQTSFGNRMRELGVERVKLRGMVYVGLAPKRAAAVVPISNLRVAV